MAINIIKVVTASFGDWLILTDAESEDQVKNAFEGVPDTVNAFVGHALHMQQQGLGTLFFNFNAVLPYDIKDTCGLPVTSNTYLYYGDTVVKFKDLV